MIELDYNTWFCDRNLKELPVHFVKTGTPATNERIIWILEKFTGRFHIGSPDFFGLKTGYVAFEDPKEALFYDLRWS